VGFEPTTPGLKDAGFGVIWSQPVPFVTIPYLQDVMVMTDFTV